MLRKHSVRRVLAIRRLKFNRLPLYLLLDVDGVLTNGQFEYSALGKVSKIFGPHDSDALSLISGQVKILFVSADHRGYKISEARVKDMGYELMPQTPAERADLINSLKKKYFVVYMGDSFTDVASLQAAHIGVVPAGSHPSAMNACDIVMKSPGGGGAVAELALLIQLHSGGNFDN
jgi:3-deoxy-D-manno-octulosonate 8-phosphate phosphatase (KDO 8-P phosphatase)